MIKLTYFSDVNYTGQINVTQFPGGERNVTIPEPLSDPYAVEINAWLKSSNDVIDLFMTVDAVRSAFHNIDLHLVMPYVPYARQDRHMVNGDAHAIRVFAKMINSLNFKTVQISDPHSDVTTALLDNVIVYSQSELFMDFVSATGASFDETSILLSPDAGAMKKIYALAQHRQNRVFCALKKRVQDKVEVEIPEMVNVAGSDVWIVDDIIDGGATFISLAEAVKKQWLMRGVAEQNQPKLHLYATHGIFSKGKQHLLEHYDTVQAYYDWTI